MKPPPWSEAGTIALIREVFPEGYPERPWFVAVAVDNYGSHEWRSTDPLSTRMVRANPPQPIPGFGFERLPFPTQKPALDGQSGPHPVEKTPEAP